MSLIETEIGPNGPHRLHPAPKRASAGQVRHRFRLLPKQHLHPPGWQVRPFIKFKRSVGLQRSLKVGMLPDGGEGTLAEVCSMREEWDRHQAGLEQLQDECRQAGPSTGEQGG